MKYLKEYFDPKIYKDQIEDILIPLSDKNFHHFITVSEELFEKRLIAKIYITLNQKTWTRDSDQSPLEYANYLTRDITFYENIKSIISRLNSFINIKEMGFDHNEFCVIGIIRETEGLY